MAAATFGELLGPARVHLDAAAGLNAEPGGPTVAAAAVLIGEIAWTLSRYLSDLAPYKVTEAVISSVLGERAKAAVDAREALRAAAGSRRPGRIADQSGAGAPDPLIAHLEAASAALTGGRDLLRTHFGTSTGGQWFARSDWAEIIASEPVTRAIVAEVAQWSRQLALLTSHLFLAPAKNYGITEPAHLGLVGVCHGMLTASSILATDQRDHPATAADAELLHAIPGFVAAPRHAPEREETVAELGRVSKVS